MTKQILIDAVIVQLLLDIERGDVTVLEELLEYVPADNLIQSLPEDQQEKFRIN